MCGDQWSPTLRCVSFEIVRSNVLSISCTYNKGNIPLGPNPFRPLAARVSVMQSTACDGRMGIASVSTLLQVLCARGCGSVPTFGVHTYSGFDIRQFEADTTLESVSGRGI